MLAFIFNFGTLEVLLVVIVAVLVFGRNLPTVAVQAAGVVHKLRRSLADLRRETGIDEELRKARRTIDAAVPREVRRMDVREIVRKQVEQAEGEAVPPQESEAPELAPGTEPRTPGSVPGARRQPTDESAPDADDALPPVSS